ncbi:MAG: right-handed parallel beta-helix repeat-containing protein [Planctomycetota bacterium]
MKTIRFIFLVSIVIGAFSNLCARDITVHNSTELLTVLQKAQDIDSIHLAPGQYKGGVYIRGISGRADTPVTIQGADPNNPPIFSKGGGQAIHMADCSHITLAHIKVQGYPSNGINIDDGGTFETPSHHILLDNITILNTGPTGNRDALKMSGVDEFVVKNCRFEGWGGSGIDLVGCHHGKITDCTFVGKEGYSQSNGVQLKGGTSNVTVEKCLFRNAGHRSINLGGSTGLQFFRPKVDDYEATDITVAGNRFIGSMSPIAWVTAKGGYVHHNTIIFPEKWILRILQETKDTNFKPCHGGIFENNLIIYDSWVNVFVNIGPRTAPETFKFRNNAWHKVDGRGGKPVLPTPEVDGMYDVKVSVDSQNLRQGLVQVDDPELLDHIGAQSYKPEGQ